LFQGEFLWGNQDRRRESGTAAISLRHSVDTGQVSS